MSGVAVLVVAAAYVIGSVPVPHLAGRARGVDIRRLGSGNVGASNVGESVSRALLVPVGIAEIAQGLAGVLIARGAGLGEGAQVAAGIAVVVAHNWNPWLRLAGGRGVGPAIGFLLALTPLGGLIAFVIVALVGVPFRASAQSIAAGLVAAPGGAIGAGASAVVVAGCACIAALVLTKRVLANGPPGPQAGRPGVWVNRLLYDRDIREREAWVRRGLPGETAEADTSAAAR